MCNRSAARTVSFSGLCNTARSSILGSAGLRAFWRAGIINRSSNILGHSLPRTGPEPLIQPYHAVCNESDMAHQPVRRRAPFAGAGAHNFQLRCTMRGCQENRTLSPRGAFARALEGGEAPRAIPVIRERPWDAVSRLQTGRRPKTEPKIGRAAARPQSERPPSGHQKQASRAKTGRGDTRFEHLQGKARAMAGPHRASTAHWARGSRWQSARLQGRLGPANARAEDGPAA